MIFCTNIHPKPNWSFSVHPYPAGPEGLWCKIFINQKDDIFFVKSQECKSLLHFFIFDLAGNVPKLQPLGLIRNFPFQANAQKYSVGMLVDGMRPLFSSGVFIYVGWREPKSCSGRVIFSYLFLTGIDRFYYFIEQGQPCLTLPFSPKSLKCVLI